MLHSILQSSHPSRLSISEERADHRHERIVSGGCETTALGFRKVAANLGRDIYSLNLYHAISAKICSLVDAINPPRPLHITLHPPCGIRVRQIAADSLRMRASTTHILWQRFLPSRQASHWPRGPLFHGNQPEDGQEMKQHVT